jgi:hypothetical protein
MASERPRHALPQGRRRRAAGGCGLKLVCAALLIASAASGCGSSESRQDPPRLAALDVDRTGQVERCTNRFLRRIDVTRSPGQTEFPVRRYVQQTYCGPFATRGWVYDDGTLRIDAHLWLQSAGTCATARPGQPARTIPCEPEPILDCAILHQVRRDEVRAYLRGLQQARPVECDDGTPLDQLGAE